MRFWDSSAIVPLLCLEKTTPAVQRLYEKDRDMLVWPLTRTEILSALCRRVRQIAFTKEDFLAAKQRLRALQRDWTENDDYDRAQGRAERLLELHSLSAANALQLAAAIVSVEERTQGFGFVTLDERLAEAAAKEGFTVEGV